MRRKRALTFFAWIFLPSCLLVSEKANRPPQVTIVNNTMDVYRQKPLSLSALVKDDQDAPSSLRLTWIAIANKGSDCDAISKDDFRVGLVAGTTENYDYTATTLEPTCVCVEVTDHQGATAHDCHLLQAKNLPPVVVLEDVLKIPSGEMRPLHSAVRLTAAASKDPESDPLQYVWAIHYSGADPLGKVVHLGSCTDTLPSEEPTARCFYATAAGTYEVTLKVADTVQRQGISETNWSEPVKFIVPVDVDRPPCIERTFPDSRAQRILLSRSTDLGGLYESRVFQVLSVADDGEPFPLPLGTRKIPAKLIWYVFDSTQPSPTWVRQASESDQLLVSQSRFPNARPGDTVRIRLEVRDSLVDANYQDWICPQDQDYCCAPGSCAVKDACLRWTTWTVQFQP